MNEEELKAAIRYEREQLLYFYAAYRRAMEVGATEGGERQMEAAARHAATFTALVAIADGK